VFVLTTLTALTQGFGITLLLPLLRATQPSSGLEDAGTAEKALYGLLSWIGVEDSIVGILGFIVATFILKGALQFVQKGYNGYLQSELIENLKMTLYDRYGKMSYSYYMNQNSGHFINVINQQVTRFFKSFRAFASTLGKVVSALSFFAFAFLIAWKFAVVVVFLGLCLLFLFSYLNDYVRTLSRKFSQELSQLNKLLVQSLQAFKYVVATGKTGHLRGGVLKSVRKLKNYIFRQRVAKAFTNSIREPTSVLIIAAVVGVQALMFEAPLAPIFVALLLFHKGTQAVMQMQSSWQWVMDRIGAVEMVDEEIKELQKHQEKGGDKSIQSLRRGIEMENVCFAYNEDDGDVLHDVNITIPADTSVAFVGESGAGKSTVVDLLTLMLKPRTGEIKIDGIPCDEIELSSWRSKIGYVSQETVIFDDTVANNISLWQGDIESDPEHREWVYDAARRAHADHFIRGLPEGYQTVVGDRGVRLSGGQRQRLFVARELFKQPDLLLLDEATSDLDTASEQHIQNSIDALKGEVTVVSIAHRLSTVKNADQIFVLDEGRVVEKGTYHELRDRKNGQFSKMLELQRV
jgi:subfamily B ATP-binding cassette protein MsbA